MLPPVSRPPAQFMWHFLLLTKSALKRLLLLRRLNLPNEACSSAGSLGLPQWNPDDMSSPVSCYVHVLPCGLKVTLSLLHACPASYLHTFAVPLHSRLSGTSLAFQILL